MGDTQFRWTGWTSGAFCGALAAVTVATFASVLTSDFIRLDDPRYITENENVLQGLSWGGSVWAFTTFFKSNWHPITWLSHMLDVALFGVDAGRHHAMNLILHVANAIALFFVLRSATGAPGRSAVVATLFALHPTHVESVAWVAERKDVLSTFFWLLSTASFLTYARRGGALRYALIVTTLSLGLASKATLVTLPFVFLLLDYWPLKRLRFDRTAIRIIVEKLPLMAIVVAFSALTFLAQSAGGGVEQGGGSVSLLDRLGNAVMSYGLYLGKTVWPADLSILYPHPDLPGGTPWRTWQIASMGAALLAMSAFFLRARRRRYLAVGWLWFIGTLVPMVGIVQVGTQGMADRYTYVSCIGLYLIAAWGGADLLRWCALQNRALAMFAAGIFAGCIAALGLTSQRQAGYWHDTVSLFEHCLAVAPGAAALHNNLGNELFERGDLEESIRHHRIAVEIWPDMRKYHRNLAVGLKAQGDLFEAKRHLLIGNGLELDSAQGQIELAKARLQQRNYEAAHSHLERALEIDPTDVNAHVGLAVTYQLEGNSVESMRALQRGVQDAAEPAVARVLLAQMLVERGDTDGAHTQLEAARSEEIPEEYLLILGHGFAALGELDKAITQYRRAVELNPSQAGSYVLVGDALLELGEREEAVTYYRQAVMLSPESELARQRLANALGVQPAPSASLHSPSTDSGPR